MLNGMDMVMDNGDMVEQADEVYGQILGEIGMNNRFGIKGWRQ